MHYCCVFPELAGLYAVSIHMGKLSMIRKVETIYYVFFFFIHAFFLVSFEGAASGAWFLFFVFFFFLVGKINIFLRIKFR